MTATTAGSPGRATAGQPHGGARAAHPWAGTGVLLRLALRRDRLMTPLWVVLLGGSVASVARSFAALYGTAAERTALARSMNGNSSLRALYGPVFNDSVAGLTAWRMGGLGAVLAAVMSLVVVVRHTREEEETGRQELLSSAAVGRRAPSPRRCSRPAPPTPCWPASSRPDSPRPARPAAVRRRSRSR